MACGPWPMSAFALPLRLNALLTPVFPFICSQEEGLTELLMAPGKLPGCSGTRALADNLSDLRAQVGGWRA